MIPYHEPYPLNQYDKTKIFIDIDNIIDSGKLTNGRYVEMLEERIRDIHNVNFVIAVSSCTQALNICINYMDRRIQLPAFIWNSLIYPLHAQDKNYKFIDINQEDWLPTESIELPERQPIFLHTFGNIGQSIYDDAVYDGSHCLGAEFRDIGLATCISLAPTKLITSMEGGLILTNEPELEMFARDYRDKCCRMSEVHAAFCIQNLRYIHRALAWKKKCYNLYKKNIPGQFQKIPDNSSYNTIGFLNTEKLKIPDDIGTRQYYVPLIKGLKNTDFVYENMICLPSYYNAPIGYIIDKIRELNSL